MYTQYRIYVNKIEGVHDEKLFYSLEKATAYAEERAKVDNFKEVKNIFITEEGFEDNGKQILEKDIYCKRNPLYYNKNDELEIRIEE